MTALRVREGNPRKPFTGNARLTSVQRRGPAKAAAGIAYPALVAGTRITDDKRDVRAMLTAKSHEFSNVLVCFAQEEKREPRLNHLTDPAAEQSEVCAEEKWVTCVALARARDRLFVSMPELSRDEENSLGELRLKVTHLS